MTMPSPIPFKVSDRVRIKEGTYKNLEGDVKEIDEANQRITITADIHGRLAHIELAPGQIEYV